MDERVEITTKMLDELALKLKEAIVEDQAQDALTKLAKAKVTELKEAMIKMLEQADKSSYLAEGVGMCVAKKKMSVTTPKDIDSKKLLFKWIQAGYGDDGFWNYMSINSMTLNTLFNEALAGASDPAMFSIPGLLAPTEYVTLSFTKR